MTYRTALTARAQTNSVTPQSQPIPGRESAMVENRAGGVVFKVDCWTRLARFLILGSDAPTYYADARELTLSSISGVIEALKADGLRVVREIVDVSVQGRAPKNDSALYALALCTAWGVHGKPGAYVDPKNLASVLTNTHDERAAEVRKAAFAALPKVARTGTHVMQFVGYMEQLRGWGPQAFKGVGAWIAERDLENLELQAVKYRQREGWTLRDILRLSHPKVGLDDVNRRLLIEWILHRDVTEEDLRFHDDLVAFSRLEAKAKEGLSTDEQARYEALSARFIEEGRAVPRVATARRHQVRPGKVTVKEEDGRSRVVDGPVIAEARQRFRLVEGLYAAREAMDGALAEAARKGLSEDKAKTLAGKAVAKVIRAHSLPREGVPTEVLNSVEVWDALLEDMPLGAMVRNLNKMTQVGLLTQGSEATAHVVRTLKNAEHIRKARLHPFAILMALKVYQQGFSPTNPTNPNNRWQPVSKIVDALDEAFYLAFKAVKPTGKRVLQAFDVSVSMATGFLVAGKDRLGNPVNGPISARVASAAMGMVINAVEDDVLNVGFCGVDKRGRYTNTAREFPAGVWKSTNGLSRFGTEDYLQEIDLSARRRLDDVCRAIGELPMGGTDCALPILYAMDRGLKVDCFIVYTDNETWKGTIHPVEALRQYRQKTGIAAKLIAVAMATNEYSIADPDDPCMLDIVGFDADAPAVIADFIKG